MFCDRLRATRISKGLTLQKTADALDIPLRTYQNYEAGVKMCIRDRSSMIIVVSSKSL